MVDRLALLRESGESGLGQMFEQEREHLRNFLQRRINRKLVSRIDSSDVIQEIFVRAQQALPAYLAKPVIPPMIWLRHLSVQVLSEVHRKQFRAMRTPYLETEQSNQSVVLSLSSSSMSIVSKVEKADLEESIRAKLHELDQIDREVLEMRHVDGCTFKEIASALDMKFETVKKRYYRAFQRFKGLV